MSVLAKIKENLKRIKDKPYEPKFVVGDVIYNKKYNVLRKVKEVVKFDWDKKGEMTQYRLDNMNNPHTTAIETIKDAARIDVYYIKVDERAATILYGVKK